MQSFQNLPALKNWVDITASKVKTIQGCIYLLVVKYIAEKELKNLLCQGVKTQNILMLCFQIILN